MLCVRRAVQNRGIGGVFYFRFRLRIWQTRHINKRRGGMPCAAGGTKNENEKHETTTTTTSVCIYIYIYIGFPNVPNDRRRGDKFWPDDEAHPTPKTCTREEAGGPRPHLFPSRTDAYTLNVLLLLFFSIVLFLRFVSKSASCADARNVRLVVVVVVVPSTVSPSGQRSDDDASNTVTTGNTTTGRGFQRIFNSPAASSNRSRNYVYVVYITSFPDHCLAGLKRSVVGF